LPRLLRGAIAGPFPTLSPGPVADSGAERLPAADTDPLSDPCRDPLADPAGTPVVPVPSPETAVCFISPP